MIDISQRCGNDTDTEVHVIHSEELSFPADLAWSVAGRFNDLTWLPGISSFSWEGNIRQFSIGGAHFIERKEYQNDADRAYAYSLIDGPVPVRDYRASLRVEVAENGCRFVMESRSRVAPERVAEIQHIFKAAYSGAAGALRKRVQLSRRSDQDVGGLDQDGARLNKTSNTAETGCPSRGKRLPL